MSESPVPPRGGDTERKPLPCIVCGFQPESAFRDHVPFQPSGATMFDAGSGHYGSTVWDVMSSHRSLMINVCDECLTARSDRVAVALHTPPVRPDVQFVPWKVDDDV